MNEHNHFYQAELSVKTNPIKEDFFNYKSKNEQEVNMLFTIFYCLNTFVLKQYNHRIIFHPRSLTIYIIFGGSIQVKDVFMKKHQIIEYLV